MLPVTIITFFLVSDIQLDCLKIDRSFVKDIPHSAKDAVIAKTIIALARRLNLKVVAEGVESDAQMQFLISIKCNELQGVDFSRPLPAAEIDGYLELQLHVQLSRREIGFLLPFSLRYRITNYR